MEEWPGYAERFNGSLHRDLGHLRVTVEETKQRQAELAETIAGEQQKRETLVRTLLERHEELKLDFEGLRHACVNQLEGLRKKTDEQSATLSKHRARLAELHEDHEDIRQSLEELRGEVAAARPQKQLKAQLEELISSSAEAQRGQQQELKQSISEHAASWERKSGDLSRKVEASLQLSEKAVEESKRGLSEAVEESKRSLNEAVEECRRSLVVSLNEAMEESKRSLSEAKQESRHSLREAMEESRRSICEHASSWEKSSGSLAQQVEETKESIAGHAVLWQKKVDDLSQQLDSALKAQQETERRSASQAAAPSSQARSRPEAAAAALRQMLPQELPQAVPQGVSDEVVEAMEDKCVELWGAVKQLRQCSRQTSEPLNSSIETLAPQRLAQKDPETPSGMTEPLSPSLLRESGGTSTTADETQWSGGAFTAGSTSVLSATNVQFIDASSAQSSGRPSLLHIVPPVGVQTLGPHPQSSPFQFAAVPMGATAAPSSPAAPTGVAHAPGSMTMTASLQVPQFAQIAQTRRLMVPNTEPSSGAVLPGSEGLRRSASWSGLKGHRPHGEGGAAAWHGVATPASSAWQPALRRSSSGSAIMANSKGSSTAMQAPSSGSCSVGSSNVTLPCDTAPSCPTNGLRGFGAAAAQLNQVMQAKVLSGGLSPAQFAAQVTGGQP